VIDWAFPAYDLAKIFAFANVHNRQSWRVMEKLGMQREATLRQHIPGPERPLGFRALWSAPGGMGGEQAMSYDEAFSHRYEEWSADMTADIPFYVQLARDADGPVVELAIGNGRVAVPVAQAIGRRVTGIDSSPSMLQQARTFAAKTGVELDLIEGDMRDLALKEPAALIYCPYRALLHLPSWADRRHTFERVAASLQPGGRFAWNAFSFDHRIATRLDGQREEHPVPHTNLYSVGENRIDMVLDSGARSSLWWATKNEWLGLIDVAGLEVEALYGGFAGEPFVDDSHEYVFVARRPRL
jgi:ubiquinone/menaquinone biosynthesis C-methylase UbiE